MENQRHDLNEDRASQSGKQQRGHVLGAGRLPLNWKVNCRHAGAKTEDRTPAQSRPLEFQNFPQFIVIHTVKGFGIVNKTEIDVFLELS